MANGHVPLEGSERQPLADARRIGPVPSDQTVRVTVIVSRAHAGDVDLHLDVRVRRVVGDRDLTSDAAEAAADLGDHQMPADELHRGVGSVDLVDTGPPG